LFDFRMTLMDGDRKRNSNTAAPMNTMNNKASRRIRAIHSPAGISIEDLPNKH
jgi:hypothetical protein